SGEIEHSQASRLADIISLIPGIEKSGQPGLSKSSKLGIRAVTTSNGSVDALDAFGTTIIIDGVEMTNDANAKQRGVTGTTGIDLRMIPADNIEVVEVISGVASVKYGNYAEGVVNVITKSDVTRPKLKAKMNPDTKTLSYSAGKQFKASNFNYHFDYGYSERDLRVQGDEYHRIYLKTVFTRYFAEERLKLKPSFSFNKRIDSDEPQGQYNMIDFDNGYRLSGRLNIDYKREKNDILSGRLSFDMDNKQHYREKWVTDQITTADTIYSGYVGAVEEIGIEWYLRGRVEREVKKLDKPTKHTFLYGSELNYETNIGDGLILDTLLNYYGTHSARRSASFEDYPAFVEFSVYAEDKIKREFLGLPVEFVLGLRYDVYNPTGINFSKMFAEKSLLTSKHGDFLSPRFNMRISFSDNFKLRFGAGRVVKGISLAQIHKATAYYKFLYWEGDSSYIVEESYLQKNPDLQAYSTKKYDLSFDMILGDILGLTTTAYWSESSNRPMGVSYPWGFEVNPDTISATSYSIFENRGWRETWGIETSLNTKRINGIRLNFNATYKSSHSGRSGLIYDSSPDTSYEDIWYPPYSTWIEKVVLDYKVTYVSQRFGIWMTVEAQQTPLSHKRAIYYGGQKIKTVDAEEHLFTQGMTYWYSDDFYDYKNKWLMNFRLSKSIFNKTEVSLYINNVLDDRAEWVNPFTG
ncbi:TonB-dependent receptor plug domain-containing protein, partial [bacterium]|nr:TonB-dependent receptor plug domain-containing protein [bacterium]